MRYERFSCGVVGLALVVLAAGCSKSPTSPSGNNGGGTPTPTAVAISGSLSLAEGATSQLTATATLSDGTTQVVTSQATWRSSNLAVATVSATGLLTSVGPGTSDISAAFGSQTGRGTAQVSAAQYRVTVALQSIIALASCDDFTQGLTSGEFGVRILAIPSTGSQATLVETPDYPGSASGPRGFNLAKDDPSPLDVTRSFTLSGQTSQSLRLQFNATEWDEQIVLIPPSIRWIHDSRMSDRTASRTHTLSNGAISSSGPNTLTLGDSNCGIRVSYSVSAARQ